MLTNIIKIEIEGKTKIVKEETMVKDCLSDDNNRILAVKVNNSIHSIYYKLVEDSVVEPITFYSDEGKRIYARTLKLIFLKACYDLSLNMNKIEFTNKIQNNYFIRFKQQVDEDLIEDIREKMWNIIMYNIRITKHKLSYEGARKVYKSLGSEHQLDNFRIKTKDNYTFYECDNYYNYLYGLVAPTTGYITNFEIKPYKDGAILFLPDDDNIDKINTEVISNNVINEFNKFKEFEKNIEINSVSDLNMHVLGDTISNDIRYAELNHSQRILEILKKINSDKDIRAIFIAGPSSSGKTTFSQKLEDGLKIVGKRAIHISMDNYFHDLEKIPVVDGKKDYESINNLDLKLFSIQMNSLLNGNSVRVPEYNFKCSKKEFNNNNVLYMSRNDILIIEGIHALNPKVHKLINAKSFKIYLAPLVTLGLDHFTKVSSNDTRLIRRIVRDSDTRGVSPEDTLSNWKKVLDGERKNIFPYVNLADAIFNTNLVYELGVLKPFAEKLLLKIPENSMYYSDARRLYKLLNNFLPIETTHIPNDSILKEFIGNGCFKR